MDTKYLTKAGIQFFIELYEDSGNWSGTPLFGGNVGGSKESCGFLVNFKKAGLLTTWQDEDNRKCHWVDFTDRGHEYYKALTGKKSYPEIMGE